MFCSYCGAQIPDASPFCSQCGAAVTVPPAPSRPSAPGAAHPAGQRGLGRRVILGAGLLAGLAALVVLGLMFLPSLLGGDGKRGTGVSGGVRSETSAPSASMFRGNPARTGEYPGPGLEGEPRLLWRFQTGAGVSSSPAVVDGVVYVESGDGFVYALDAEIGEERWRFQTGDLAGSSPAVVDEMVYVGGTDGLAYALDAATGEERWRFQAGVQEVQEGDVASRTIRSPQDATFESDVLTEQAREAAADAVPAVFVFDPNVQSEQLSTLAAAINAISQVRDDATLYDSAKRGRLEELSYLSHAGINIVLGLSDARWQQVMQDAEHVLVATLRQAIGPEDVRAAQDGVFQRISLDLTADEATVGADLVRPLIVPTLAVDEAATWRAREAARQNVDPVQLSIAEGQLITEKGQPIDSAAREILEQLGLLTQMAVTSPAVIQDVVVLSSYATGSEAKRTGEHEDSAAYIYAIDVAAGQERWRSQMDSRGQLFPPAVAQGLVYVGGVSGISALDVGTGVRIWHQRHEAGFSTPVIDNEAVYAASRDGSLYALDAATGRERWRRVSVAVFSPPAVAEGVIYLASDSGYVYAFEEGAGEELWRFLADDYHFSYPIVTDDVVYVGGRRLMDKASVAEQLGVIYALDARTGEELWRFETIGEIYSSPAVVDGTLYVGSSDGFVYAIGGSE